MLASLTPAERVARLETPDEPPAIVLDTDAYNEVDDQFAIAYVLRAPDVSVEAIYAAPFHNDRSDDPGDGMEKSYDEIERLLERLGRSPEGFAFRGSDGYLPGPEEPVESPAVSDLIERARADRGAPLHVVAIGAPTNVASALLRAPDVADEVVVTWLGGHPHDWRHAREFNLRQDLAASRVLFDSGVPLLQVPCKNVAEHLRTTLPELDAHLPDTDLGEYLFETVRGYADDRVAWSKVIWDVATIGYLRNPDWVATHLAPSPILTEGVTWSRDPERHLIRVAHDVDRDAVFGDLFSLL